jgi:hypothetical protein
MGPLGLFQHLILRGSFARFPQNRSPKARLHKQRELHPICAQYDDLCALPYSSLQPGFPTIMAPLPGYFIPGDIFFSPAGQLPEHLEPWSH